MLSFRTTAVLLVILVPVNKAAAQTATYFCSAEVAGGLVYQSNEWRSGSFKPSQKFILKTKFLRSESMAGSPTDIYTVSVTPDGHDRPDDCFSNSYGHPGNPLEVPALSKFGIFTCSTITRTLKFNLKNRRFLSAYLEGYIDGDSDDDTPVINAGKCTKIN